MAPKRGDVATCKYLPGKLMVGKLWLGRFRRGMARGLKAGGAHPGLELKCPSRGVA